MGHSIITCGNCDNYIMEGRNDWNCDECGWHMDCTQYPHGTMKLSKDYRKGLEMTDRQFELYFDSLEPQDILDYLGKCLKNVQLVNGESYHISNYDDLLAMVDQEMYQEMTGND